MTAAAMAPLSKVQAQAAICTGASSSEEGRQQPCLTSAQLPHPAPSQGVPPNREVPQMLALRSGLEPHPWQHLGLHKKCCMPLGTRQPYPQRNPCQGQHSATWLGPISRCHQTAISLGATQITARSPGRSCRFGTKRSRQKSTGWWT